MLEVFAAATTNAQRALIGVAESGLPHKFTKISFDKKSKAFLKANKYGRVPTLLDHAAFDGKPMSVAQSGAILMYVAEKSGRLMPSTPRERSQAQQWLMMHASDLGPVFTSSYYMQRLKAPSKEAVQFYKDRTVRYFKMVDDRLAKSRFLAGDEFSIADCAVYPDALWGLKDFPAVAKLKNLQRWFKEVGARPGVKKAMAFK